MSNRTINRYDPMPSTRSHVRVSTRSAPPSVDQECALAVPVAQDVEPARELDLDAAALRSAGFTGGRGQTLVLPGRDGILRVSLDTGIPCGFGVLTVDTMAQALARVSGGEKRDTGRHAVEAVLAALAVREGVRVAASA